MKNMLIKVGWKKDFVEKSRPVLPISGWMGDNLLKKSENMGWWSGVEILVRQGDQSTSTPLRLPQHMCPRPGADDDAPMRMPISGIYKIKGVGDVLAGRVEQGVVKPSEEVIFMPTHTAANPCDGKVFTIEMHHTRDDVAKPGDNVGLNIKGLDKQNMPRVGDVMVYKKDTTLDQAASSTRRSRRSTSPARSRSATRPSASCAAAARRAGDSRSTGRSARRPAARRWRTRTRSSRTRWRRSPSSRSSRSCATRFKNCEGLSRIAFLDGNTAVMLGKVTTVISKADMPAEETGKKKK